MPRTRLRIYHGPEHEITEQDTALEARRHTVEVTWGEILPILADALRNGRGWVNDFQEDLVTISSDLYEVILAYEHYRRPSA